MKKNIILTFVFLFFLIGFVSPYSFISSVPDICNAPKGYEYYEINMTEHFYVEPEYDTGICYKAQIGSSLVTDIHCIGLAFLTANGMCFEASFNYDTLRINTSSEDCVVAFAYARCLPDRDNSYCQNGLYEDWEILSNTKATSNMLLEDIPYHFGMSVGSPSPSFTDLMRRSCGSGDTSLPNVTFNGSLSSGLVAYWDFNNLTSDTFTDLVSGRFNVSCYSGTCTTSSGILGNSLYVNDYTRSPSTLPGADLLGGVNGDTISFNCWINKISSTTYAPYFFLNGSSSKVIGYSSRATDKLHFEAVGSGLIPASTNLTTNTWYMASMVVDSGDVYIYQNGVLVGSGSGSSWSATNGRLRFGYGDGVNALNGLIDECSVYNRSITASEVSQLYNSGNSLNFYSYYNFSSSSTPSLLSSIPDVYLNSNSSSSFQLSTYFSNFHNVTLLYYDPFDESYNWLPQYNAVFLNNSYDLGLGIYGYSDNVSISTYSYAGNIPILAKACSINNICVNDTFNLIINSSALPQLNSLIPFAYSYNLGIGDTFNFNMNNFFENYDDVLVSFIYNSSTIELGCSLDSPDTDEYFGVLNASLTCSSSNAILKVTSLQNVFNDLFIIYVSNSDDFIEDYFILITSAGLPSFLNHSNVNMSYSSTYYDNPSSYFYDYNSLSVVFPDVNNPGSNVILTPGFYSNYESDYFNISYLSNGTLKIDSFTSVYEINITYEASNLNGDSSISYLINILNDPFDTSVSPSSEGLKKYFYVFSFLLPDIDSQFKTIYSFILLSVVFLLLFFSLVKISLSVALYSSIFVCLFLSFLLAFAGYIRYTYPILVFFVLFLIFIVKFFRGNL